MLKEVELHSPKIIVGSDGSHIIVRKSILTDHFSDYESLQHIVDVKYDVFGKGQPLNLVDQVTLQFTERSITSHVKCANEFLHSDRYLQL